MSSLQATGKQIALKQMKNDALCHLPPTERQTMESRMVQEIELMFGLKHPNVIQALTKPEVNGKGKRSEERGRSRAKNSSNKKEFKIKL